MEEPLRAAFRAAYPRVNPSEALSQRVAAVTSRHHVQPARMTLWRGFSIGPVELRSGCRRNGCRLRPFGTAADERLARSSDRAGGTPHPRFARVPGADPAPCPKRSGAANVAAAPDSSVPRTGSPDNRCRPARRSARSSLPHSPGPFHCRLTCELQSPLAQSLGDPTRGYPARVAGGGGPDFNQASRLFATALPLHSTGPGY